MRRIASAILVVSFIINCTHSVRYYDAYNKGQPIVISERVGETLDAVEGQQFALFQQMEDFESATFYQIVEGGYEVSIVADGKRLIAVNRDPEAVEILRYYIDNHDTIVEFRDMFEKKWSVVDYDILGIAITKREISAYTSPGAHAALGVGCGLLSAAAVVLVQAMIWFSNWELFSGEQDDDGGDAFINAIVPIGLGVGMGIATYSLLSKKDRATSLKMIQEERKPRFAERLEQYDLR